MYLVIMCECGRIFFEWFEDLVWNRCMLLICSIGRIVMVMVMKLMLFS